MTARKKLIELSDEELEDLFGLLDGADSAELKLTVPESEHRAATVALGVDPLDAQIRQVYFFDTPDLVLDKSGIVVRARRVQARGDDTVIKLRPVAPGDVPESLRELPNLVVEVDAMPGGYVCSASLKGKPSKAAIREVAAGEKPIRKLFSKEQRAFYAEHAPAGLELDDLSVLGPVTVFKLKFSPSGYERKLVAEMWLYPDYSRILELSTKCLPNEMLQVAAESKLYLTRRDLQLGGDQQTKTRSALRFFSNRQKKAEAAAALAGAGPAD
jgi:hypothetical protein